MLMNIDLMQSLKNEHLELVLFKWHFYFNGQDFVF